MNSDERAKLKELIDEHKTGDYTQDIRERKHSTQIQEDMNTIIEIRGRFGNPAQFIDEIERVCTIEASFLCTMYNPIFKKMITGQIEMGMMNRMITELKSIESGDSDQHDASFRVGTALKEKYVDKVLNVVDTTDAADTPASMSWADWKNRGCGW